MTKAMDWVEGFHGDYPFFMWIDMFDPHEPWDPPVEYGKKYDPDFDPYKAAFPPSSTKNMSEADFRCVKAGYAGECSLVDAWVGRFMDALEEKGVLDDTIVVFTSDHGGMMGEQGEVHKASNRLRNQVTQVPLLIRHPKGEAAGARVKGFVQHQDIMPTVLSMMGEDVPERCNGRTIWPLAVEGSDSDVEQIITCFGWHASVRNAKWNYIAPWSDVPEQRQPSRIELYDLENDPEELTNVIDEHPEVAAQMHAWMEDYLVAHRGEGTGDLGPGQTGPEHDQAYI
jgi:arylsulfatase A-like enzyme